MYYWLMFECVTNVYMIDRDINESFLTFIYLN